MKTLLCAASLRGLSRIFTGGSNRITGKPYDLRPCSNDHIQQNRTLHPALSYSLRYCQVRPQKSALVTDRYVQQHFARMLDHIIIWSTLLLYDVSWISISYTAHKATIHQVTIMLAPSKNVLFPSHTHLLTTGADDPSLAG